MALSPRPATPDDLTQLAHVEEANHPKSGWTEALFRAELAVADGLFLVLTDDETDQTVAGYIVARPGEQEFNLLNLVVSLPHRGLGLGVHLLQLLIAEGLRRGYARIALEVRKGNRAAVQLYQKQGFLISAVRRGLYQDGEDGFFMELPLQGQDRVRI